ncbi:MAG TPA: hypothetical protein VHP34_11750 [Alphaproteobacteria bacterium]|nr:hypothetical protein [Alphaproteobacteria bacterium]
MAIPFAALTRKALMPLIVICLIAAVGSAGMILFTGTWYPLWPPVLAIMLSPLIFPILLVPAAFFSGVMRVAQALYPNVARICILLTFGWFIGVLSLYAFMVMHLSQSLMVPGEATRLPALVWTIAIAVLPWAIFATRDRENILFTGMVFMMLVAATVSLSLVFFFIVPFWAGYWIFCGLMAVMLSLQALYEHFFIKIPAADNAAPAASPPDAPSED